MVRRETLELLNRAEYMLWVIAATDVDGVTAHRRIVLLKLDELESKARELGILNLYATLIENGAVSSKHSPCLRRSRRDPVLSCPHCQDIPAAY